MDVLIPAQLPPAGPHSQFLPHPLSSLLYRFQVHGDPEGSKWVEWSRYVTPPIEDTRNVSLHTLSGAIICMWVPRL